MSWEDDRTIDFETSPTTGEVMLSASDVLAWLRYNSERETVAGIADRLASNWLKASSQHLLEDGGRE